MGVAERREREKQKRKESIVDAAEKVFFSSGFENATMLDVARNAELSKGAIYLYFKSKNELCMAILNRSLKLLVEKLQELCDNPELTGLEKLGAIGDVFINFSNKHKDHYKALLSFREHRKQCPEDGKIYQECLRSNNIINAIMLNILQSGIDDHSIQKEIDKDKIIHLIWGNYSGMLPSSILTEENDGIPPQQIIRYFFQLIVKAIAREI